MTAGDAGDCAAGPGVDVQQPRRVAGDQQLQACPRGQRRPGQQPRRDRRGGRGGRAAHRRRGGSPRRLGPLGRAPGDGQQQGHAHQPPARRRPAARRSGEDGHAASSPAGCLYTGRRPAVPCGPERDYYSSTGPGKTRHTCPVSPDLVRGGRSLCGVSFKLARGGRPRPAGRPHIVSQFELDAWSSNATAMPPGPGQPPVGPCLASSLQASDLAG